MTNTPSNTNGSDVSIAVLVTNYNKIDYIADSIKSAINQGTPIYVIDDCSNDGSYEYLQGTGGIRLLRTATNSGPCVATLTAAQHISEEYTILLDGDDVLCQGTADYFSRQIQQHAADAIYTRPVRSKTQDMRNKAVSIEKTSDNTVLDDPMSRYLQKQWAGTSVCVKTSLLIEALSVPGFFIQDLLLAFNISKLANKVVLSNAHTHYYSLNDHANLTANGLVQCKDIARLYLYASQFPAVRNNPHFSRYTRRIYGSLPAFSHQYPWLSPKWKKRLLRWYRRYLMPRVDYAKIQKQMQYFLDNADRYFDA